jgi:hypothetical protein
MKSFLVAAVATLALGACAPEYAYVPLTNATIVGDHVAAEYPIPADMPHGDVRVASFGIVEVAARGAPAQTTRALHLRFTISNNEKRDWTFDTGDQRVELHGYGSSVATFAEANAGTQPPIVTVPPLGQRVVDLYFPLPGALQHAHALPAFDVLWRVDAGDRFVARRSSFQRIELEPPPTYYPY